MIRRYLFEDQTGSSLVTYALVLPIFLLVVFGLVQVYQIITIRESTNWGVQQLITYLRQNPQYLQIQDPEEFKKTPAWRVLQREFRNRLGLGRDSACSLSQSLEPEEIVPAISCGQRFTVTISTPLGTGTFPFLGPVEMGTYTVRWSGTIECAPDWTPPQEVPTGGERYSCPEE